MLWEGFEPLGSVQSGCSVVLELGIEQNAPRRSALRPLNRGPKQGPADTAVAVFRVNSDPLEVCS